MKEEKLNTLRQQDVALHEALRLDEAELPQMPADLNARVMKQVAEEPRKSRIRQFWPWMAAACVAGLIAVLVTPPKEMPVEQDNGTVVAAKVEQQPEQPEQQEQKAVQQPEEPQLAEVQQVKPAAVKTVSAKPKKQAEQQPEPVVEEQLLAQETTPATVEETATAKAAVTLTERDIPITRPENYKYTPEELALMKKQANEAYLKWVELELEIAKHNLEQTAQQ